MSVEKKQRSFPSLKYPSLRDGGLKTAQQWLRGKRMDDGAEALWRVHDKLYDLTEFVREHPGGSDWLAFTKGTDVTEPFETHHLTKKAEEILKKYYVRNAKTPRNSPFTFNEQDFYKTLKVKVREKLKDLPLNKEDRSDQVINAVLIVLAATSAILPSICMAYGWKGSVLGIVPGFLLSCLTVAAHNYFHQKDNWRMYLFNLSGMSFREWRITHAMSHHMLTNTAQDIELSGFEPIVMFLPDPNKSLFAQFGAIYWPITYFPVFIQKMAVRYIYELTNRKDEIQMFHPTDILNFVLPFWLIFVGGASTLMGIGLWMLISSIGSWFFVYFGLTAGHHNNNNFFEGDKPRSDMVDWGVHQLDTMVERVNFMPDSTFAASLTTFGDHCLHHMFPTIDAAYLKSLYPLFLDHCEKYGLALRTTNQMQATFSKCRQITRKRYHDFSKR